LYLLAKFASLNLRRKPAENNDITLFGNRATLRHHFKYVNVTVYLRKLITLYDILRRDRNNDNKNGVT